MADWIDNNVWYRLPVCRWESARRSATFSRATCRVTSDTISDNDCLAWRQRAPSIASNVRRWRPSLVWAGGPVVRRPSLQYGSRAVNIAVVGVVLPLGNVPAAAGVSVAGNYIQKAHRWCITESIYITCYCLYVYRPMGLHGGGRSRTISHWRDNYPPLYDSSTCTSKPTRQILCHNAICPIKTIKSAMAPMKLVKY